METIFYILHITFISNRSEIYSGFGVHAMHVRRALFSQGSWHAAAQHGARPQPPRCGLSPDTSTKTTKTPVCSSSRSVQGSATFRHCQEISYLIQGLGRLGTWGPAEETLHERFIERFVLECYMAQWNYSHHPCYSYWNRHLTVYIFFFKILYVHSVI